MFDLSVITVALTASAPSINQVLIPESQEAIGVDSSVVLLSLIESAVSSRVYPSILPDDVTYPAAVYRQIDSDRADYSGYPILRSDAYSISVIAETHTAASAAAETMRAAMLAYDPTNAAGAVELGRKHDDYYPDFDLHEVEIDCQISHLARTNQSLPAAFVYSTGEDWEDEGALDGCVIGQAVSRFDILLVAKMPAGGVSALGSIRNEILDAVIGLQPAGWETVDPEGGGTATIYSSYVLWRDSFTVRQTRTYSQ